jgi:Ca2+-binding EF-hand superfamily protein
MTTITTGQAGAHAAALSQMRQQLFSQLDADANGGIDETEFLQGASGGTSGSESLSESKLKAAFSAFDSDADGQLTQGELATGFQKLDNAVRATLIDQQDVGRSGGHRGPPPSPPSGDELLAKLDTDQSGGLDVAEFVAGAPAGGKGPSESELKELFVSFDSDSDGSLSAEELQAGFESRGPGGPQGGKGAGAPPPPPPQAAEAADSEETENPFLSLLANSGESGVSKTDLASLLASFAKLQQSGQLQGLSATA